MKTSNWAHHDTPYDYDSMMHYGSRFFSKNRGLTIQTKNSRDQNRIGSRRGFSKIDIQQIIKMYCNGNSVGSGGSGCKGGTGGGKFFFRHYYFKISLVESKDGHKRLIKLMDKCDY